MRNKKEPKGSFGSFFICLISGRGPAVFRGGQHLQKMLGHQRKLAALYGIDRTEIGNTVGRQQKSNEAFRNGFIEIDGSDDSGFIFLGPLQSGSDGGADAQGPDRKSELCTEFQIRIMTSFGQTDGKRGQDAVNLRQGKMEHPCILKRIGNQSAVF